MKSEKQKDEKSREAYIESMLPYSEYSKVEFKKDKIIFWICFFPFSMLHFALKDLMRFIVEDVLKATYTKVSMRALYPRNSGMRCRKVSKTIAANIQKLRTVTRENCLRGFCSIPTGMR